MKFTCKFPRTRTVCTNLEKLYSFLISGSLGSHELLWECPTSKVYCGIRLKREQRKPGDYYREPYPLYLEILYPDLDFSPTVSVQLTSDDYMDFVRMIEAEIKAQYTTHSEIFNTGKY